MRSCLIEEGRPHSFLIILSFLAFCFVGHLEFGCDRLDTRSSGATISFNFTSFYSPFLSFYLFVLFYCCLFCFVASAVGHSEFGCDISSFFFSVFLLSDTRSSGATSVFFFSSDTRSSGATSVFSLVGHSEFGCDSLERFSFLSFLLRIFLLTRGKCWCVVVRSVGITQDLLGISL